MDPLVSLRDIHYPGYFVSKTSAITGWIIIILLLAILASIIGYFFYRNSQRVKRIALRDLAYLEQNPNLTNQQHLAEISKLLRRIILAYYPREKVACLSGKEWLIFLDRVGKTTDFTQGIGQCMINAPYMSQVQIDLMELYSVVKKWIISCHSHR